MEENNTSRWHLSKYNLFAKIPDKDLIGCVNLLKGSYSLFTFEDISNLQSLKMDKRFLQNGYIVNYDEVEGLKFVSRKNCGFSNTVSLTICPTLNCNFRCPYCFENHRIGKMSEEVQEQIITFIRRMVGTYRANRISVTWFGGEPLLASDVIESLSQKIIEFADEKKIQYNATIVTNGYLLSQENIDMLYKYKVRSYQITFDGLEETHDKTRHLASGQGTFSKIVENLTQNKIIGHVSIRHNINEDNKEEENIVKKYVENMAKISGNNISYYPAIVTNNEVALKNEEKVNYLELQEFAYQEMKKKFSQFSSYNCNYCGAQSITFIVIDELGNLYKCWEDSGKIEHSFGKINEWSPWRPIQTARNPQVLINYINSGGGANDKECEECIWLPVCKGGCPQRRLYYTKACVPYRNNPEEFVLNYIEYKEKQKQRQRKCSCC